tara:strand:- start:214 stop:597 length:384 start_codon:yes stop_codon:yes gene_type:complete
MTDIATALNKLGVTEWVLRGEPTSEAEFNEMFRKVTGADANGTAIESDDTSTWGVTWSQVSAKKDELVAAEPMRLLRAERDRKLADTDWWATSDRTMTDAQTTYRQALRDVPATYSSLDDVVWPTKP